MHPVRVAIDVDASLRLGPLHLGVRRSPVHTAAEAADLAQQIARRDSARLVGLMLYDAQIAGLPDASAAVRLVKRASEADLARRRAAVLTAVQPYAELEFVNGGGTGSLHLTSGDGRADRAGRGAPVCTARRCSTATAPSRRSRPCSSPPRWSGGPRRATRPSTRAGTWPPGRPAGRGCRPRSGRGGLELIGSEAAGEVQTPAGRAGPGRLQIGDRVCFRHAKAGEACERFDRIHLVRGGELVDTVPTYRGEGKNFG